jgi:hypothetical protein
MRSLKKLKEQGVEKFKGGAADLQDLSGPNKPVGASEKEQHHGMAEEKLDEVPVSVGIGSNRRAAKKTSFAYTSLGGQDQKARASAQRQGNQKMANRYEEIDYKSKCAMYAEEATKKVMKKLKEKKGEQPAGRTATGQSGDVVDTAPTKPELTGYH